MLARPAYRFQQETGLFATGGRLPLSATYHSKELPRLAGIALLYFVLGLISISFATIEGPHTLICLPSGLALATLLLLGEKYWPSLLAGAFAVSLLKGFPAAESVVLGLLMALQTLLGTWLLRQTSFQLTMPRARDFFFLFLLAGIIASGLGALASFALMPLSRATLLSLWSSNLLGVILITPFILIWRQPLHKHLHKVLYKWRTVEFVLLAILSFLAGQIIFLDLFHASLGNYPQEYLMFIFVVWAAIRFGRHGVLLILGMTFIQAMTSVSQAIGYFGKEIARGDLINFSLYCTELVVIGMLLAGAIRERNSAVAVARDNEARVKRLTQLYQTLSHVNQGIARLENEGELFPLVCRTVVQYGGFTMAWIGIPGESARLVNPVACFGQGTSLLDAAATDAPKRSGIRGPAAVALRQKRTVVINRLAKHPKSSRLGHAVEHGFLSVGAFPILRDGRPFAVLSVLSSQQDAFDTEAIALFNEMSLDVGLAMDNFDREQQRMLARHALANSEQRFRAFFERSMIGMATFSAERRWLEVNDALCHMLGYTRDELLGLTWQDISHPDDVAASASLFNRTLRGKIDDYALEKRYLHKDGRSIHAHVTVRCLRREDGSINYFAALIQDITESKKSAELIWRQANFDSLTGLINRNLFRDRLQQEIKKSRRSRQPIALVFVDLDRFKEVNDSLGHATGDSVLAEAARRIESCVRASDTLARLGGDEFVIIIAPCPDKAPVAQIAQKIIARLGEPFIVGEEIAHITASIGVAFYPDDASDMESLLIHADQAMYASKNQGRSRLSYFTRSMHEAVQVRHTLINDLRDAMVHNQFQLYFQPIVDLSSKRIAKAEALLRWNHPTSGLIEPKHFIPLAEETGMIFRLGDWAFKEAALWAKRWARQQQGGVQISVNKSPLQFMAQGIEPSTWIEYLKELGVPGQQIAIEITEGLLMNSEPAVMTKLLQFRDAGIQVSLDDFGTGYSSLSYLNKFDIDYLKIDQSFIRNLVNDPFDRSLSEAIIVMAHTLGLKVIAEGVETQSQLELLTAAGCDYAQGYFFSPPVTGPVFEAMLQ